MRAKVSLTGQFASVDEDLTGPENLVLVARLLGFSWGAAKARAAELLEAFELTDAAGRQVRTYSGGMRRRLDIAASLVRTPELLFLDEPTSGLDPRSRRPQHGGMSSPAAWQVTGAQPSPTLRLCVLCVRCRCRFQPDRLDHP